MVMVRVTTALALVTGVGLLAPTASEAALVDFSGGGTAGQLIANGSVIGGIQLNGFYNNGANAAVSLTQRAAVNDRGVGVCSPTDTAGICGGNTWSGDTDEIDNVDNTESLRLTPTGGLKFTGVFGLSSLDNNGGASNETGYVTWSGGSVQFSRSGATIISGATSVTLSSWTPPYGSEGNTFLLTIVGGGIENAPNVTFFAGCLQGSCGTNNDYLVAGAAVVPLPAALPMFLSALAGLGLIARRKS